MKITKLYLIIVSLVASLVSNAIAAAWTGSMSEPENMKKIDGKSFYVITTADELAWFASQVNSGKSTINAVLGNNIVFGKDNSTRCSAKWTPIGKDPNHKFGGILDGAGYTIYGIYVDSIPVAGIIGVLETGGVVRNLRANTGYIRGSFRVGGFVAHNDGTIQSAENNNRIEGFYKNSSDTTSIYVGGIAGHNNGMIATSSNKMPVNNKAPTSLSGGIAGKNSGQIYNSGNSGSVSAIIYKTGARYEAGTSDGIYSGGIAGHNTGSINRIKNIGNVSADGHIVYYDDLCVGCNIEQSQDVYRKTYSGGIVGLSSTTISNAINNGKISNSNKKNRYINGIVASGIAKNSIDQQSFKYWLNETEIQGTAENMQKDQFAWMLNTTDGTEENSGVWTRGTDGYPTFANEDSLPIYKVVFNDDGVTSNRYTNYKGLATFPDNPEPVEGYIFSGWFNSENVKVKPSTIFTADQTVNAVYVDASDVYYTINFYNEDKTLLKSYSAQHGSIVTYDGEEPVKAPSAEYSYSFAGWNVEPTNAVEDFDYYATYTSTKRSYSIEFRDFDGTLLQSSTNLYGSVPNCTKNLNRASTMEWNYSFKGWTPTIKSVSGEAVYTAIYDSSKVEYTVTFMNGSTVFETQQVAYGTPARTPSEKPFRDGYKFVGWSPSYARITTNLTISALFEELIYHTITILDNDGNKVDNVNVVDEEPYTLPAALQKEGYEFIGWFNGDVLLGFSGDKIPVSADMSITAHYKILSYTVTFVNYDGTIWDKKTVEYGTVPSYIVPSRPKTAQYTYYFNTWSPIVGKVTKDITYTAVYLSVVNEYKISFVDENGNLLKSSSVAYGVRPTAPATPIKSSTEKYTYNFAGWSPSIEDVTGPATYTALFDSSLNNYSISFKNGMETLQSTSIAYGNKPEYKGTVPTRTASAKYSYTFAGWNPAIENVTGPATYTALFDSTLNNYTVVFMNGTTVLQNSFIAYGEVPEYKGAEPSRKATDKYSFKFTRWSPAIEFVTKNTTYEAIFDSTEIVKSSSSSNPGSSSSEKIESSSSSELNTLAATSLPLRFRLSVVGRNIQIAGASVGTAYALLDMQGRIVYKGSVSNTNFSVSVSYAGSYLMKIGNQIQRVNVK